MSNLLQETITVLSDNDISPAHVLWVGSQSTWFTWDEFAAIADVKYDNGYGGQEVASDLIVVGDDWWLERHEYDGSEWWEFKRIPRQPDIHSVLERVVRGGDQVGWLSLDEMNSEDES